MAVSILENQGFTDVTNIAGGFEQMKAKGVETSPMTQAPSTHL